MSDWLPTDWPLYLGLAVIVIALTVGVIASERTPEE